MDHILYDIKHVNKEKHLDFTGVEPELIHDNLRKIILLDKKTVIRVPVIPGFNSSEDDLESIVQFLMTYQEKIIGIDFLPYHMLGVHKYKKLNREYLLCDLPMLDKQKLKNTIESLRSQYPIALKVL